MSLARAVHPSTQRVPVPPASDPGRSHDAERDRHDAMLGWHAHLAAGRIGSVLALAPEHRANLEATERALGVARPRHGAVW